MGCVKDVGLVGLRREDEISGEREEVLERKREGAFECGENRVHEVIGGVRELEEEKAAHGSANHPDEVEETKGEKGGRN